MELMNPIIIIICLIISIAIFFINFNRKKKYTTGKKVANTEIIKETEYYKSRITRYKILSMLIKILNVLCILLVSILIARPITIQTKTEEKLSRDIILSIDISTSQNDVNLELVKKFKSLIHKIEGDRIGIIIYNTSPVVFCPLTDDYDYINEKLDVITRQIELIIKNNGVVPTLTMADDEETYAFWNGGTIANNAERGSSLVGDGLAGAIFSFPDLKTDSDRTRIIVFATDNYVLGTETVTLEDACILCKQYGINLYAYCPSTDMNKYATTERINSYKKAVEQNAGGKFYTGDLDKMTSNIVDEIHQTKATALKTDKKTYVTDHPEFLVISIVILYIILIIIEKRIKL